MSPMRLLFAGSGAFGIPTLRGLLEAKHQLVQVITQPDRPAGRGRKLTPTPIAQLADELALPTIRTDNINTLALPPADAMIVVAFGQKISPTTVNHPCLGSINLHASRLPRYRGAAPINWAIINGDAETGNSIIRLAPKMDAGAVLAMSRLTIGQTETAGELHDRLALDGAPLVLRVLEELALGQASETPQDETQSTLAPKLTRENSRLDWTTSADQLARRIRGLSPWPGCRVRLLDAAGDEVVKLTLLRARPCQGEGPRWQPGEIMLSGAVASGNDTGVEILECQPEGKRPMSLQDFRNGYPWQPGLRLESI